MVIKNLPKKITFSLGLLLSHCFLFGQVNSIPDSVCALPSAVASERASHTNLQTNLCKTELSIGLSLVDSVIVGVRSNVSDLQYIQSNNNWYAFLISSFGRNITRLDYGNSLDNTPNLVNLGDLNGALNSPTTFTISRINNRFEGVIVNNNGNSLLPIHFPNGINQAPVAISNSSIPNPASSIRTINSIVVEDTLSIFTTTFSQNAVYILKFGNSLENPTLVADTFQTTYNQAIGSDVINQNGTYYLGTYSNAGRVFMVKFKGNLKKNSKTWVGNLGKSNSRNMLMSNGKNGINFMVSDRSNLYTFRLDTVLNRVDQINLAPLPNRPPFVAIGGIDYVTEGGMDRFFVQDQSTSFESKIHQFTHAAPCTPIMGWQQVEYTALDSTTDQHIYLRDSIYLYPDPQTGFDFEAACTDTSTVFRDTINTNQSIITNWQWDINAVQTITNTNRLTETFLASGNIEVQLTVTDLCNKQASALKTIQIVSQKDIKTSFTIPDTLCTLAELEFKNSSEFNQDPIASQYWLITDASKDTIAQSSDRDFMVNLNSEQTYQVTLQNTGVSGCGTDTTITIVPIQGPASDFGYQDTCAQQSLTLYRSVADPSITQQRWFRGDELLSSDSSVVLDPNTVGPIALKLVTSNQAGCQTEQSRTIQIFPLPDTDFDSTYACLGQGTQLLNRSSIPDNTPLNYQWYAGNQLLSLDQNPVVTLDESAQPFVRLVATSVAGCQQSITKELTLVDRPRADFGYTNTCLGEPTVLSDSSVFGQAPKNWRWLIEGTSTSTQNTSFIFRAAGTYRVQLIATDALNCADTLTQTVLVNELPTAAFEVQNACIGQETVFINRTASPLDSVQKIQWSFVGLANVQTGDTARIIYNNSNTNLVELSIETQNGCKASVIESVSANPLPKSAFEVNTLLGAPPLAIQTTNTSTNADAYIWLDELAMVEETSENLAYMYEDFGVYTLQLVALTAQGCADTSSKVIRAVDPVSNIRANSISTQRVGGLVFPTLSLTNLGNYDINQLRLEVDYGGQFSTFQTLTDELPAGASKNIALNNGIESGRYSTLSYVCIRSVGENLLAPETDTSDNSACVLLSPTFEVINTFPSPATTELNIDCYLPSPGPLTVAITNAVGQELYRFEYPNLKAGARAINLDLSFLENDIYLVSLATANQKIVRKFQKVSLK